MSSRDSEKEISAHVEEQNDEVHEVVNNNDEEEAQIVETVEAEPITLEAATESAPSVDASSLHDGEAPAEDNVNDVQIETDVDAEIAAAFANADVAVAETREESDGEDAEAAELPDNVHTDTHPAPVVTMTYEPLRRPSRPEEGGEGGEEAGDGSAAGPRMRSAGSQTDSRGVESTEEDETEAAMTAEAMLGMNPSLGIQADAEVDFPPSTAAPDVAATVAAAEEEEEEKTETKEAVQEQGGDGEATGSNDVGASIHAAPALARETAPDYSQAHVGTVVVNTLILPMKCHTYLTLPVARAVKNARSRNGEGASEGSTGTREACWLLSARGLFEVMATRLCVHPQSFHIYRNGERVRFNHTLLLDIDRTAISPAQQTTEDENTASSPAPTASRSGCYEKAEPLWISVEFPDEADMDTEEEDQRGEDNDFEEEHHTTGGAGGGGVPTHLLSLHAGEVLERCLLARKEKPKLLPQTLVEGRHQGLSFDEMIRQSYAAEQGIAGDEETTAVVVVVRATDFTRKPFIGGYRVKQDPHRVLLHACTQLFMKDLNYSPFPQKAVNIADTCTRQTQTYGISRSCQTSREACVQTPSFTDCGHIVLDDSHDYVVVARPYFSAAQLHELQVGKAITLQKMYRQWKARCIRRGLEEEDAEKQRRAEDRQRAEEAAQRAQENRAHLRRSDPRTAADFDQLREDIMQWRLAEATRLTQDSSITPSERQMTLLAITKEEVKLLQELEHRRRLTLLERKDQQFSAQLARTAADKVWGASGVHVTTPETVRAGELRDLYVSLTNHNLPVDERLDVLLHVKWTVKEFAAATVSEELSQLIDREADLLHRGRRETSLLGLRKRIEVLFRQFLEDPTFNPGMAPFTTTAVGRAKVRELGLDGTGHSCGTDKGNSSDPPYGGYTASKCASCAQLLRTATIVSSRRQRAGTLRQDQQQYTGEPGADHIIFGNSAGERGYDDTGRGNLSKHAMSSGIQVHRSGSKGDFFASTGGANGTGGGGGRDGSAAAFPAAEATV